MTPTPSATRRARLLVGALLIAVFAGGALIGAAVDRLVAPATTAVAPATSERRADDARRQYIFEQLDLTPEQRARIDEALELRRAQTDSIWRMTRPQMRAIIDSLRDDVRAVLTDEQRAEYDRLLAEHDAKRRRERKEGKDGQR